MVCFQCPNLEPLSKFAVARRIFFNRYFNIKLNPNEIRIIQPAQSLLLVSYHFIHDCPYGAQRTNARGVLIKCRFTRLTGLTYATEQYQQLRPYRTDSLSSLVYTQFDILYFVSQGRHVCLHRRMGVQLFRPYPLIIG